MMQRIFEIDPWQIVTHQWDPTHKRLQESMTSIGNGYMGMRGMFEEDYSGDTHPGIYLAGVWYPDKTVVGWWKNGYPKYFGKVINAVNFAKVNLWLDGQKVDLATCPISDFSLALNMQTGILTRQFTVKLNHKRVRFKIERFVSIAQKQLFTVHYQIENLATEPVAIKIVSALDADVANEDANYHEKFWQVCQTQQQSTSGELLVRTKPNQFGTPRFTVGMQMTHQTTLTPTAQQERKLQVENGFSDTLAPAAKLTFNKRVVVVTSRDYDDRTTLVKGMHQISKQVQQLHYQQLVAAQAKAWRQRWDKADVEITGDAAAQQGIRFNLFQLFSTFYGEDKRLNIGPKGFTGEKYGGATYWDTEGFALPLYLALTDKQVATNLLEYRYHQLPGAFHNAQVQGLKGALFPMVTFNGIENHNEWEITFEEIHRNGTIAYAIYNYTRYTGDATFLKTKGIDVLTAISRFWADRVHWSERRQKYMLHGVTGPNEYENNVNNNWYTNFIARWTLQYTLASLPTVSAEKQRQLAVTTAEKQHWQAIIDQLVLPEDKKLGIFIQNDDYLDKALKPAASIPKAERPINQHWSWDKILRSPYIKQADVLQGIWYFIDQFPEVVKRRNFDFYEPLTVHESSLSACVHAILAADLHDENKAVEMYQRTARLDLDNYNNDTDDGLHITSMTGSWLAIVQGFAGMRIQRGQLAFKPFLPRRWRTYQFRINFRDRLLKVKVNQQGTQVELLRGAPLTIQLNGQPLKLQTNN
uniref:Maltose phosphorylase / Trehalose phosphorylase n=1 Tax=Loigolactobacillus rennini TaxID=238013 RepID=A0A1K2I999_9LACO|nr:Maltose phosphorylase / Trehalose phosphorylase [Loigolactobacillus rennini]